MYAFAIGVSFSIIIGGSFGIDCERAGEIVSTDAVIGIGRVVASAEQQVGIVVQNVVR